MGICISKKKYNTITDNNYDYVLYDEPDNRIIYTGETHLVYDSENETYNNERYYIYNNEHYDSVYHSANSYVL